MAAPEVDVGRSEIVEALVVSAMIVMLDESRDLRFEVFLEEVVFEQDAVKKLLSKNRRAGLRPPLGLRPPGRLRPAPQWPTFAPPRGRFLLRR